MKIQELFDVTGKITVITGGASGIGYAYAEVMADNGAIVTITDINKEGLDQAAAKLTARGGNVFTEIADVTDKASLKKAFDVVAKRHGRIDVVFANAADSAGRDFLTVNAIAIRNVRWKRCQKNFGIASWQPM